MATGKPRITITLEPDEYAVLHRLAKLQGGSMSRILREFIGEVAPILSKVADSLELAQRASDGAKANLRRAAEAAEEELRPLAEFAANQFDIFAGELERIVRTGAEAGEGAGCSEGGNPRPVITGVTKVQRRSGTRSGKGSGATSKLSPGKGSGRAKHAEVLADADNNGKGARLLVGGASREVK